MLNFRELDGGFRYYLWHTARGYPIIAYFNTNEAMLMLTMGGEMA